MRYIQLTQGLATKVDDDDYELLTQWKWCAQNRRNYFYAARGVYNSKKGFTESVSMHRQIMNVFDPTIIVDHKDRDTLNNQKSNLRVCTKLQNNCNKKIMPHSSIFMGVSRRGNRWYSSINDNGKQINLGYHTDEIKAAIAYNEAAKRIHGEFANLNTIQ